MELPQKRSMLCQFFITITFSVAVAFPSLTQLQAHTEDCYRIWPLKLTSRLTPCYYSCSMSIGSTRMLTLQRRELDGTKCWAPKPGICLQGKCYIDAASESDEIVHQRELRNSVKLRRIKRSPSLGSFWRKFKMKGGADLNSLERLAFEKEERNRQRESLKEKITEATTAFGAFVKDSLKNVTSHFKTAVHNVEHGIEDWAHHAFGKDSGESFRGNAAQPPAAWGLQKMPEIPRTSFLKAAESSQNKREVSIDTIHTDNIERHFENAWPEAKLGMPSVDNRGSTSEPPWWDGNKEGNSRVVLFASPRKLSDRDMGANGTGSNLDEEAAKNARMSPPVLGRSSESRISSQFMADKEHSSSTHSKFKSSTPLMIENVYGNMNSLLQLSKDNADDTITRKQSMDNISVYKPPPLESSPKPVLRVKDSDLRPRTEPYPANSELRATTSLPSAISWKNIPNNIPTNTLAIPQNEAAIGSRHYNFNSDVPYGTELKALPNKMIASGVPETNSKVYSVETSPNVNGTTTESYLYSTGPGAPTPLPSSIGWTNTATYGHKNVFTKAQHEPAVRMPHYNLNTKPLFSSEHKVLPSKTPEPDVSGTNSKLSRTLYSPNENNQPSRSYFSHTGLRSNAPSRSVISSPSVPAHTNEHYFTKQHNEPTMTTRHDTFITDVSFTLGPKALPGEMHESDVLETNRKLSSPLTSPSERREPAGAYVTDIGVKPNTPLRSAMIWPNMPTDESTEIFTKPRNEPAVRMRQQNYNTDVTFKSEAEAFPGKMHESHVAEENLKLSSALTSLSESDEPRATYFKNIGLRTTAPLRSPNNRAKIPPQNIFSKPWNEPAVTMLNKNLITDVALSSQPRAVPDKLNESHVPETNSELSTTIPLPNANHERTAPYYPAVEPRATTHPRSAIGWPAPHHTPEDIFTKSEDKPVANENFNTDEFVNSARKALPGKVITSRAVDTNSKSSTVLNSPKENDTVRGMEVINSKESPPVDEMNGMFESTSKKGFPTDVNAAPFIAFPHRSLSPNAQSLFPGSSLSLKKNEGFTMTMSPKESSTSPLGATLGTLKPFFQSIDTFAPKYTAVNKKEKSYMLTNPSISSPKKPWKSDSQFPSLVTSSFNDNDLRFPSNMRPQPTIRSNASNGGLELEATVMPENVTVSARVSTNFANALLSSWRPTATNAQYRTLEKTLVSKLEEPLTKLSTINMSPPSPKMPVEVFKPVMKADPMSKWQERNSDINDTTSVLRSSNLLSEAIKARISGVSLSETAFLNKHANTFALPKFSGTEITNLSTADASNVSRLVSQSVITPSKHRKMHVKGKKLDVHSIQPPAVKSDEPANMIIGFTSNNNVSLKEVKAHPFNRTFRTQISLSTTRNSHKPFKSLLKPATTTAKPRNKSGRGSSITVALGTTSISPTSLVPSSEEAFPKEDRGDSRLHQSSMFKSSKLPVKSLLTLSKPSELPIAVNSLLNDNPNGKTEAAAASTPTLLPSDRAGQTNWSVLPRNESSPSTEVKIYSETVPSSLKLSLSDTMPTLAAQKPALGHAHNINNLMSEIGTPSETALAGVERMNLALSKNALPQYVSVQPSKGSVHSKTVPLAIKHSEPSNTGNLALPKKASESAINSAPSTAENVTGSSKTAKAFQSTARPILSKETVQPSLRIRPANAEKLNNVGKAVSEIRESSPSLSHRISVPNIDVVKAVSEQPHYIVRSTPAKATGSKKTTAFATTPFEFLPKRSAQQSLKDSSAYTPISKSSALLSRPTVHQSLSAPQKFTGVLTKEGNVVPEIMSPAAKIIQPTNVLIEAFQKPSSGTPARNDSPPEVATGSNKTNTSFTSTPLALISRHTVPIGLRILPEDETLLRSSALLSIKTVNSSSIVPEKVTGVIKKEGEVVPKLMPSSPKLSQPTTAPIIVVPNIASESALDNSPPTNENMTGSSKSASQFPKTPLLLLPKQALRPSFRVTQTETALMKKGKADAATMPRSPKLLQTTIVPMNITLKVAPEPAIYTAPSAPQNATGGSKAATGFETELTASLSKQTVQPILKVHLKETALLKKEGKVVAIVHPPAPNFSPSTGVHTIVVAKSASETSIHNAPATSKHFTGSSKTPKTFRNTPSALPAKPTVPSLRAPLTVTIIPTTEEKVVNVVQLQSPTRSQATRVISVGVPKRSLESAIDNIPFALENGTGTSTTATALQNTTSSLLSKQTVEPHLRVSQRGIGTLMKKGRVVTEIMPPSPKLSRPTSGHISAVTKAASESTNSNAAPTPENVTHAIETAIAFQSAPSAVVITETVKPNCRVPHRMTSALRKEAMVVTKMMPHSSNLSQPSSVPIVDESKTASEPALDNAPPTLANVTHASKTATAFKNTPSLLLAKQTVKPRFKIPEAGVRILTNEGNVERTVQPSSINLSQATNTTIAAVAKIPSKSAIDNAGPMPEDVTGSRKRAKALQHTPSMLISKQPVQLSLRIPHQATGALTKKARVVNEKMAPSSKNHQPSSVPIVVVPKAATELAIPHTHNAENETGDSKTATTFATELLTLLPKQTMHPGLRVTLTETGALKHKSNVVPEMTPPSPKLSQRTFVPIVAVPKIASESAIHIGTSRREILTAATKTPTEFLNATLASNSKQTMPPISQRLSEALTKEAKVAIKMLPPSPKISQPTSVPIVAVPKTASQSATHNGALLRENVTGASKTEKGLATESLTSLSKESDQARLKVAPTKTIVLKKEAEVITELRRLSEKLSQPTAAPIVAVPNIASETAVHNATPTRENGTGASKTAIALENTPLALFPRSSVQPGWKVIPESNRQFKTSVSLSKQNVQASSRVPPKVAVVFTKEDEGVFKSVACSPKHSQKTIGPIVAVTSTGSVSLVHNAAPTPERVTGSSKTATVSATEPSALLSRPTLEPRLRVTPTETRVNKKEASIVTKMLQPSTLLQPTSSPIIPPPKRATESAVHNAYAMTKNATSHSKGVAQLPNTHSAPLSKQMVHPSLRLSPTASGKLAKERQVLSETAPSALKLPLPKTGHVLALPIKHFDRSPGNQNNRRNATETATIPLILLAKKTVQPSSIVRSIEGQSTKKDAKAGSERLSSGAEFPLPFTTTTSTVSSLVTKPKILTRGVLNMYAPREHETAVQSQPRFENFRSHKAVPKVSDKGPQFKIPPKATSLNYRAVSTSRARKPVKLSKSHLGPENVHTIEKNGLLKPVTFFSKQPSQEITKHTSLVKNLEGKIDNGKLSKMPFLTEAIPQPTIAALNIAAVENEPQTSLLGKSKLLLSDVLSPKIDALTKRNEEITIKTPAIPTIFPHSSTVTSGVVKQVSKPVLHSGGALLTSERPSVREISTAISMPGIKVLSEQSHLRHSKPSSSETRISKNESKRLSTNMSFSTENYLLATPSVLKPFIKPETRPPESETWTGSKLLQSRLLTVTKTIPSEVAHTNNFLLSSSATTKKQSAPTGTVLSVSDNSPLTTENKAMTPSMTNTTFRVVKNKSLPLSTNHIYSTQPIFQRDRVGSSTALDATKINPFQDYSFVNLRPHLHSRKGTVFSNKLPGRAPQLAVFSKSKEPLDFNNEKILRDELIRFPSLMSSNGLTWTQLPYEFSGKMKPEFQNAYFSYEIKEQSLLHTLPLRWYPMTFEHLLGQAVQNLKPLLFKRENRLHMLIIGKAVGSPIGAYSRYISRNAIRNIEKSRTQRASHFIGKLKHGLRNPYPSNILKRQLLPSQMYAMRTRWYPMTFEHVLGRKAQGVHEPSVKWQLWPSTQLNDEDVQAHASPLSAYARYISRIARRNIEKSRTKSTIRFLNKLKHVLRNPFPSNILRRQLLPSQMYAVRARWYPTTMEHVLGREVQGVHDPSINRQP